MPARPVPIRTRIAIDLAMVLLAVASVGLVLYEIVYLSVEPAPWLDAIDLAIVLIFAAEFVWSARASGDWKLYTKENWYDLPGMIWIPGSAFEAARGFRLLRLVRLFRLLRLIRAAARLRRLGLYLQRFAGRAKVAYIAFVALGTILVGGLAAFVLEADENPLFGNVGDAFWWALVTTATVGYGDIYPVTTGGRLVGGVLMIVGVGVIGTLAGSLGAALLAADESQAAAGRIRVVSKWHR